MYLWWYLIAKNNYMFRPIAAISRLLQFCSKSIIYMPILRGDTEISASLRVKINLFSRKSNGQWLVGCKFMGRYSIQSYRACGISQFGSSSYTYADRVLTRVSQSVPRERPGSTDLSRLPLQRWPYWHNKSCPAGTLQISSLSLIFVWPRIVSMILWLQPKRCNYF